MDPFKASLYMFCGRRCDWIKVLLWKGNGFVLLYKRLEDRKREHSDRETPILEAFWSWLDPLMPLRGSSLAKAVIYAKNQKPYMEYYLLDGRCSISNNAADNSIRPFVVGRKN